MKSHRIYPEPLQHQLDVCREKRDFLQCHVEVLESVLRGHGLEHVITGALELAKQTFARREAENNSAACVDVEV